MDDLLERLRRSASLKLGKVAESIVSGVKGTAMGRAAREDELGKTVRQVAFREPLESIKAATKFAPPYQAYRAIKGQPMKPLEYGTEALKAARLLPMITSPIGYSAYRTFPSLYGAGAAAVEKKPIGVGALKAVREYAGPSKLLGAVTPKLAPETPLGKTIDIAEMGVGLAFGKGIDDIVLSGVGKLSRFARYKTPDMESLSNINYARRLFDKARADPSITAPDRMIREMWQETFKRKKVPTLEGVKKGKGPPDYEIMLQDLERWRDDVLTAAKAYQMGFAQQPVKRTGVLGEIEEWANKNMKAGNVIKDTSSGDLKILSYNGNFVELQNSGGKIETFHVVDLHDAIRNKKIISQPKLKVKPPEPVGKEVSKGVKERGFIKTVREAPPTVEPVAKKVKGFYTPITNKETVRKASIAVDTEGWDVVKQRVLTEPLTAKTNAEGLELMRRSQDEGKYDEAIDIAEKLAVKGTQSGQAIQAFSIWGRMTPEGMTRYAEKIVMNANENMGAATKFVRKALGKDVEVKLTAGDAKNITNLMKKANATKDEIKKMEYVKEALNIINEKTPYGVNDFLDEYRYNNMLSNPKSHLRNAYNNALQTFLVRPATLLTEGKPVGAAKYYGGLLTGIPDSIRRVNDVMVGKVKIEKPDIRQLRKGRLPTFMQLPTRGMEAGDQFFSALIESGMKAAGASSGEAKKIAASSLLRGELGEKGQGFLNEKVFDRISKWLYKAPKPVRWFIPFVRTPMNAAKQWIDYSPVGVVNTVGNKRVREQTAKALLGSAAMFYGAHMAGEDRTTWSSPTDQTEKQLFYATGRKPFSVKFGDKWVPMWYFGPFAFAVALPAAVKHYQEKSKTAMTDSAIDKITGVSGDLLKFVAGQTPLTGLEGFMKVATGDIDYTVPKQMAFTVSQMIPFTGMLNYIADALDPIYRKPKGFVEGILSGIPGMTKGMEPYTEPYGELARRLPINFMLPYDIGKVKTAFEEPLKVRTQKLQERAYERQQEKELEKTQGYMVTDDDVFKYFNPETATIKKIDLSDLSKPALTAREKMKKDKERFSVGMDVYRAEGIDDSVKDQLYNRIGVKKEDLDYYDVASEVNDVKSAYVMDEITGMENREDMIKWLVNNRRIVNGKILVADGVIDDLYDDGIISYEEKKALKKFKIDQEGEIKVKVSGRGKKAKLKKAKFVPLKVSGKSIKIPRIKTYEEGVSDIQNIQFPTPQLKVSVPEVPQYKFRFNV